MPRRSLRLHHAVVAVVLACLVVSPLRAPAADPAGRTPRTAAVACCERAEEVWTILGAWHRSCAKTVLSTGQFAAMLSLQSRTTVPASVVGAVCGDAAISRDAVVAFVRFALCASLPRTHPDLARSVYSALMDEAPALEDELTDDIEATCRDLQERWSADPSPWLAQLHAQTSLVAAQAALCAAPCRRRDDAIDGATYDL